MKQELEKSSSKFMLTLTPQERKKLKLLSIEKNTTMQSLLKYLLHNKISIEDL